MDIHFDIELDPSPRCNRTFVVVLVSLLTIMALSPVIRHLLDDVDRQASLFDQHFGLELADDDLIFPRMPVIPALSENCRPWRYLADRDSCISTTQNNKDGFKVNLDLQHFKPEELTVKVVGDSVVVEAKHEERQDDHGFISRHMQRRYLLPKDVVVDQVQTQLSSDGVLTIRAPNKMALSPVIRDMQDDVDRRASLFDQHFDWDLADKDLLSPRLPALSGYYRPWRYLAARNSGISTIQNNKDGFKVNLDLQHFKPEELTVTVVGDSVVVEAKHEERQDKYGFISRHMQRRYLLPKDVMADQVQTQLSSDGVLTITAPKKSSVAIGSWSTRVPQIQGRRFPTIRWRPVRTLAAWCGSDLVNPGKTFSKSGSPCSRRRACGTNRADWCSSANQPTAAPGRR